MKRSGKVAAATAAAGCLIFAGATVASAAVPTAVPEGTPLDCATPALEDPAGALTGTLADPAGTLQADAECLSGGG